MGSLENTKKYALAEDELKISRKDIEEMLDGLIQRSRKLNKQKWGTLYRTTLIGFKGFMKIMPTTTLEAVWSDIIRFFNVLQIRNKMEMEKGNLGDESPLQRTFAQLKKDIAEGNW